MSPLLIIERKVRESDELDPKQWPIKQLDYRDLRKYSSKISPTFVLIQTMT